MEEHGWSMLPSVLLFPIVERLVHISDIARFRAVCVRWAWALGWPRVGWPAPFRFRPLFVPIDNPPVPWLLLPKHAGEKEGLCEFLCLNGPRPPFGPCKIRGLVGRRCVGGSRDGWIVTLDLALDPRILNPITREELPLPSISPLFVEQNRVFSGGKVHSPEEFRHVRIFLSSAPPLGIAAIIYSCHGRRVAFARTGDHAWIAPKIACRTEISDVMYREEDRMFYVSTKCGRILVLDLSDLARPWVRLLGSVPNRYLVDGPKHIVFNSKGELLVILRNDKFIIPWGQGAADFHRDVRIIRLNSSHMAIFRLNPRGDWVQVFDLGDESIMVGCNHFICVSKNNNIMKKNNIYFVEESSRDFVPRCYKYPLHGGIWFTPSRLLLQQY